MKRLKNYFKNARFFEKIKTIIRFQKLAAKYFPSYGWVLAFLTLFETVSPFIMVFSPRFILDEVFGERKIEKIVLFIILMSVTTIVTGLINSLLSNKLHFISMKLKSKLRLDLNYRSTVIRYELLEDSEILDMKQNATRFLEEDVDNAIYIAPQMFSSIIATLGYTYLIGTLNFFVLLSLASVILITTALQSNTEKYAYSYKKEMAPVERRISYYIMTMPDMKFGKDMRIFNLSDWFYNKYDEQLSVSIKAYKRVFSKTIKNGLLSTIVNTVQTISIYAWLIYKTFAGGLSIGEFTMYFSAISNFSGNIMNLFSSFIKMSSIQKRMDDFFSFSNIKTENEQVIECCQLPKTWDGYIHPVIEFKDVWFKYPHGNDFALKNVSVSIPYGQKISVVGENGAGKTTFIKLLARLYYPTKGKILINGVDISTLELTKYREMLSVIFQDFSTFAFTIKENIVLANNHDKDSFKVDESVNQAGLGDRIKRLPKGIDTYIDPVFDPDGIQLSGGEFQRLALARAIYRDSPILILDEPTSAMDPRGEYEIYNHFYDMAKNKTTLFISHRLANSRICDRILVFKKGEIAEDGTHNELIKQKGLYCELFNMQKQYYNDDQ